MLFILFFISFNLLSMGEDKERNYVIKSRKKSFTDLKNKVTQFIRIEDEAPYYSLSDILLQQEKTKRMSLDTQKACSALQNCIITSKPGKHYKDAQSLTREIINTARKTHGDFHDIELFLPLVFGETISDETLSHQRTYCRLLFFRQLLNEYAGDIKNNLNDFEKIYENAQAALLKTNAFKSPCLRKTKERSCSERNINSLYQAGNGIKRSYSLSNIAGTDAYFRQKNHELAAEIECLKTKTDQQLRLYGSSWSENFQAFFQNFARYKIEVHYRKHSQLPEWTNSPTSSRKNIAKNLPADSSNQKFRENGLNELKQLLQ